MGRPQWLQVRINLTQRVKLERDFDLDGLASACFARA
jgi:hypothetical protein